VYGKARLDLLTETLGTAERVTAVHCTQTEPSDLDRYLRRGGGICTCPLTEGNLGDGIPRALPLIHRAGRLCLGSDSNARISMLEEMRWLEYGQRLLTRHRNIAARGAGESVGETLWSAALHGGAQAAGLPIGALEAGKRADLLVLDDEAPLLAARDVTSAMDSFLFAGNAPLVRHVMCGGRWVVRDFHHRDEARIAARYRRVVERLARG
jgi:formimidoylglutamate deiminase